jgi:hypothetical protein
MGDDGQMILLSALVACLCLFGVIACVAAVDGVSYGESGRLSDDGMENVRWAQDHALQRAAFYNSAYPWEGRVKAALRFKSEANSSLDSLAGELLKHGLVYRFSFNDSLAGDYAASHPGNGTVNIDGVLVEPSGGSARICGCAFDVFAYDGVTTYRACRVATFI